MVANTSYTCTLRDHPCRRSISAFINDPQGGRLCSHPDRQAAFNHDLGGSQGEEADGGHCVKKPLSSGKRQAECARVWKKRSPLWSQASGCYQQASSTHISDLHQHPYLHTCSICGTLCTISLTPRATTLPCLLPYAPTHTVSQLLACATHYPVKHELARSSDFQCR